MIKICHITSVHRFNDIRIFYRECISLKNAGYDVHLIAPAEAGKEISGIKVIAVKRFANRFARMLITPVTIFFRSIGKGYRIIHFHDPELFFTGLLLKLSGKKVIFDIHENISGQIKNKQWLPLRDLVSKLYRVIDYFSAKAFYLVLAESSYEEIYAKHTRDYEIVLNYPELSLFEKYYLPERTGNGIFYIGGITKDRGIDTVIKALHSLHRRNIDFEFHCVGDYSPVLMGEIQQWEEYKDIASKVFFYGRMDVQEGYEISKKCRIGISVLKPIENYKHSYSTKIFEYMAVGMPVITSDFQLYRDVIEKHECGICVDPLNAEELADALQKLLLDLPVAGRMAKNGKAAADNIYNWKKEEEKLLRFYRKIAPVS